MKKTDGLVQAIRQTKWPEGSNGTGDDGANAIAQSVRTYISERLPKECHEGIMELYKINNDTIPLAHWTGFNACLKSVREALGVDL